MAKAYPVDFKGTAFGDPAIYNNPMKRTDKANLQVSDAKNLTALSKSTQTVDYKGTATGDPAKIATLQQTGNANTISAAIDPTKLSAVAKLTGDQTMATLAYKGTAFGDPAAKLAAGGYPLEYKGTAFGDPAKFGGGELQLNQDQNTMRNNVATSNLAFANQSPGNVLNLLA